MRDELRLAEVWHPSVFIKEEMAERGWSLDDLVMNMGPHFSEKDWGICKLSWEMYLEIGPENANMTLGQEMADELGDAFDVNPQTFLNLHESWMRAHDRTQG